MILITDGGSTKCDWVLLDTTGTIQLKTQTEGLNPTVVKATEIMERITNNVALAKMFHQVEQLHFYGAGCGTETPRIQLQRVLEGIFVNARVLVQEDLAAAVYSVTTDPGIVCILGTGSNSCYFDGTEIHSPIPALGYTVMDEASGNYFGKQLLRDYFYKKMPSHIAASFQEKFRLHADEIKINLYQKANPNAYLASFAEFLFDQEISETYVEKLLEKGIEEFVHARILTFSEAKKVPIHFIGSIAHFSTKIVQKVLTTQGLQLGTIIQRPMEGLISYYKNEILKP